MNSQTQTVQTEEPRVSLETQRTAIDFGQRDNQWAMYDIYTAPVTFTDILGKQIATPYKAVFRSNRLVSIMSKRYQLLPNEKALQMADEIAGKIGFKQHQVYYGKNGNYMNATYLNTSDQSFAIDVNQGASQAIQGMDSEEEARAKLKDAPVGTTSGNMGGESYQENRSWEHKIDTVYFGFSIHNSIDGTSGFGAGTRGGMSAGYDKGEYRGFGFRLFTLRKVCMNGAIVRSNLFSQFTTTANTRLKIDTKLLEMPKIRANVRHIGSMSEVSAGDKFLEAITKSMTYIDRHLGALADLYKQWTRMQMTEDFAQRLLFLPEKYLPETIEVEEGKLTEAQLYKSMSIWEAFNQVTAKVWHSESLGIRSKEAMLDKLHEALYPAIQVTQKG